MSGDLAGTHARAERAPDDGSHDDPPEAPGSTPLLVERVSCQAESLRPVLEDGARTAVLAWWLRAGRTPPTVAAAHLERYATRPDVRDAVLVPSARPRGLPGLGRPATGRPRGVW